MARITASRKHLTPDPRYGSKLASKFINCLMHDGKKSIAQRVFYDALDIDQGQLPDDEPIDVFTQAVENVKPSSRSARSASAVPPTRCRCRSTQPAADAGDPLDPDGRPREEGPRRCT